MRFNQSIAVAILAFSKFDTLIQLIQSLKDQTHKPDEIIVLFQGNDTKISDWLSNCEGISFYSQNNIGSAGGFSTLIQISIAKGHDWTWIIDDDAIPELDALDKLTKSSRYFDCKTTGFLGSRITDRNGKTYMSPVPIADHNEWYGNVLDDHTIPVILSTWLGLLVSTNAVLKCGLPIKEYYLWDEDTEFSLRIAENYPSFCVLDSVFVHYQNSEFNPFTPGDKIKYLYFVRNKVATIRLHTSSPVKRIVKIVLWILRIIKEVITRKTPFQAIFWLLKGLFLFRPKIKFTTRELCLQVLEKLQ